MMMYMQNTWRIALVGTHIRASDSSSQLDYARVISTPIIIIIIIMF